MITKEEIIALLNLKPHSEEGGYFVETYRSEEFVSSGILPGRYEGRRRYSTAIYYLLTPDTFSAIHRIKSDEIFHFYHGDAVEMLQLWPDGSGKVLLLGTDMVVGMRPQVIVPREVWQGARLRSGGRFALLGTTVSPGFEYEDFETGRRDALVRSYPDFEHWIIALTKP